MLVDGHWALVGSANWDPRSLRLNFEFNLEAYDWELTLEQDKHYQSKLRAARQVTLEEVDARALPVRLRDGLARLLTPFM
jgi:cardiolipin synthase